VTDKVVRICLGGQDGDNVPAAAGRSAVNEIYADYAYDLISGAKVRSQMNPMRVDSVCHLFLL
jgi:hypothetical protein